MPKKSDPKKMTERAKSNKARAHAAELREKAKAALKKKKKK